MDTRQLVALASEMIGALAVTLLLTISPKFKQKQSLGFRYPRREGILSLVLLAGLTVLAFLVYGGQVTVKNILPAVSSASLEGSYQQAAVALVGAIIFGAALVYRRQPVRSAGWNRPMLSPALQVGIAVIILTIFLRGKFSSLLHGVTTEQGIALGMLLVLGLAEEFIFRGYIQLRLTSWLGQIPGWLATSALFTLWQLPRLLGSLSTPDLLLQLGLALAQGLLCGWMMLKVRHILAPGLYRAVSAWIAFLG